MKLPELWRRHGFLLIAMLAIVLVLLVSVSIAEQL